MRDDIKPSMQDLDNYYSVIIDGDKWPTNKLIELREWARDNCPSFSWWEALDMSDVSAYSGPDNCLIYYFLNSRDAVLFKLRWG